MIKTISNFWSFGFDGSLLTYIVCDAAFWILKNTARNHGCYSSTMNVVSRTLRMFLSTAEVLDIQDLMFNLLGKALQNTTVYFVTLGRVDSEITWLFYSSNALKEAKLIYMHASHKHIVPKINFSALFIELFCKYFFSLIRSNKGADKLTF